MATRRKLVRKKMEGERVLERRWGKPVDILGQRYRLEVYSHIEVEGECDPHAGVIRLRRQATDRMTDTLIHEILHGIFDGSGLGWQLRQRLKLTRSKYDALEEDMIRVLAPALLSILRGAGWLRVPGLPATQRHRRP